MLKQNDMAPLRSLSIAAWVPKRKSKSWGSWANLIYTGSFILREEALGPVAQNKGSDLICESDKVSSPLSLIFPLGQYKVRPNDCHRPFQLCHSE